MDLLCFFCSVLCLQCLCARLFNCDLWSPAGKGLASWLSFVVSNCEFVTLPLVSWVSCGTWLYRFLIFAPLLTLYKYPCNNEVIEIDKLRLYTFKAIICADLHARVHRGGEGGGGGGKHSKNTKLSSQRSIYGHRWPFAGGPMIAHL